MATEFVGKVGRLPAHPSRCSCAPALSVAMPAASWAACRKLQPLPPPPPPPAAAACFRSAAAQTQPLPPRLAPAGHLQPHAEVGAGGGGPAGQAQEVRPHTAPHHQAHGARQCGPAGVGGAAQRPPASCTALARCAAFGRFCHYCQRSTFGAAVVGVAAAALPPGSAPGARPQPPPPAPPPQAHDEADECNVGDTVRVHISRPLSKRKSWVVTQVLHRARVFDADSAATAAAADAAAHHAGGGGGLGAPSFAASAVPPAQ